MGIEATLAISIAVVFLWVSSAIAAPPPLTTLRLSFANDEVSASWNRIDHATGYRLLYAPYPDAEYVGEIDLGDRLQVSVRLPLESAFYVAVRPYNAEGTGWFSNIEYFEFTGDVVPVPSQWRLETFGPIGQEKPTLAGTEITLNFAQSETGTNMIGGSAGCNLYSGAYYRGDNGLLELGPTMTTLIACTEDVGTQEWAYLSALMNVAAYALEGEGLSLVAGDGQIRLNFVRPDAAH